MPLALSPHASWARFLASWLRSRRLTEPPRPSNASPRYQSISRGPKGRRGRSQASPVFMPPPRLRRGEIPSAPQGHGGSVSRRDHNPAYRRRATFRRNQAKELKPHPSNASRSSGEGGLGRGASLREAASPPESPHPHLFGREREGGDFSYRKVPSLANSPITPFTLFSCRPRRREPRCRDLCGCRSSCQCC